jgi:hypothetical protein
MHDAPLSQRGDKRPSGIKPVRCRLWAQKGKTEHAAAERAEARKWVRGFFFEHRRRLRFLPAVGWGAPEIRALCEAIYFADDATKMRRRCYFQNLQSAVASPKSANGTARMLREGQSYSALPR